MKLDGMDKKVVGLKSYPRVYFELILVGFTLIMGMSLSAALHILNFCSRSGSWEVSEGAWYSLL